MKRILSLTTGALLTLSLLRADTLPGQLDFTSFTPAETGGELVEVKLQGALLQLAANLASKDEPDLAAVLNSLKLVRVNVVKIGESNRGSVEARLTDLRGKLDNTGWDQLVNVQEKQQRVGVYVKLRAQESIEGVVVMVETPGKEAVFINVVGDVKPEQLQKLGEKLDIEPLRKVGAALHPKPGQGKEAK
jgi:hypothetical protein